MTSSVSLLGVALLASASSFHATPAFEGRVRAQVAEAWSVPPETIRLAWPATSESPSDDAVFHLAGRARDGWFALVFDGADARAVRVRAGIETPVSVAARALSAGARLVREDLREDVQVRWGPPRGALAPAAEPGWAVRRSLSAGEPLEWPAVVAPPAIGAGEPVELVWARGMVRVVVRGTALHSARRGESLRIARASDPGRLIGTAVAPGQATLDPGVSP